VGRLCKYVTRPPVSQERLELAPELVESTQLKLLFEGGEVTGTFNNCGRTWPSVNAFLRPVFSHIM
jgi:hypothetical protein